MTRHGIDKDIGNNDCLAGGRWPYARVHTLACWRALWHWAGRWALMAATAALVASAGAGLDAAVSTVLALAAWAALPLARGVAAGGAWAALAVLGTAGLGVALLVAVRQRLWSTAWREAEQALPLAPQDTLPSDLAVTVLASLPWAGLQAAGLAVWLVQAPAWLQGHAGAVVFAGAMALGLMLAGGLVLQRARRHPPRSSRVEDAGRLAVDAPAGLLPHRRGLVAWVLVLWPLQRGQAPRSARHAGITLALGGLIVGAAVGWPGWAPAWLALVALATLVAVSRARVLAALELRPLLAACAPLPLSSRAWGWRLDAASAAPALLVVAAMAASVLGAVPGARGAVLAAWVGWLVLAAALELRVPVADASEQAARWLFLLVVAVALGSEVPA